MPVMPIEQTISKKFQSLQFPTEPEPLVPKLKKMLRKPSLPKEGGSLIVEWSNVDSARGDGLEGYEYAMAVLLAHFRLRGRLWYVISHRER
jgi:hypothetical protein